MHALSCKFSASSFLTKKASNARLWTPARGSQALRRAIRGRVCSKKERLQLTIRCNSAMHYLATNTIARDVTATFVAFLGATILVKTFSLLTKAGLKQTVSRKLVHILIGILNVATWPLWSNAPYARYFAALVPAIYGLRMLLVGTGTLQQPAFVNSITRHGDREDVLRGPLIYVCILTLAILVYWRHSPIGMTAVAMMSGGDGAADLIGRKFGSAKLPWNSQKSWAGTFAMSISGWLLSIGFVALFHHLGYFTCVLSTIARSLGIISFAAAFAESLPINHYIDDNIYVPLVAVALSQYLFCRVALIA